MIDGTPEDGIKLEKLTEKVGELDSIMKMLNFHISITRENIRQCKEECATTNQLLGNLNVKNNPIK